MFLKNMFIHMRMLKSKMIKLLDQIWKRRTQRYPAEAARCACQEIRTSFDSRHGLQMTNHDKKMQGRNYRHPWVE